MRAPSGKSRPKMNILLVDDRPDNLVALEAILEDLGHNLIRAQSGTEALKRLLKENYAVVLMDVQMPEMDGYETARRIRERQKLRSVPIIFISAIFKTPEHVSQGYASGGVDYITKPLDPDALKAKVKGFVALAEDADALKHEAEGRRQLAAETARRNEMLAGELLDRAIVLKREVNAREEAENALRLREEEYRLLFEANPQPMWFFDPDTLQFLDVNEAALNTYGYARSEFLSMTLLDIRGPEEADRLRESLAEMPDRGFSQAGIFKHLKKNGGTIYGDIARMRTTCNGRPAIFVMVHNLTDRVLAEEAHCRHQEAMEELNARLRRSMAETHHRVRNNLQLIVALSELQEKDAEEFVHVHEFTKVRTHVRALAAVHNILTGQTHEEGFSERISAQSILSELVELMKQTAGGRVIIAEIEDARLSAKQACSLAVVVNEVFTNAVKYGSGTVSVRFSADNSHGRFEIADEGPGFPSDFDPGASARTGLELVQTVVRWDLQGEIKFGNGRDGGGLVVIRLPLYPPDSEAPPMAEAR